MNWFLVFVAVVVFVVGPTAVNVSFDYLQNDP